MEKFSLVGRCLQTIELLLLLANARSSGMTRSELGESAKCSPASVTQGIKKLVAERHVHLGRDGHYALTYSGEQYLRDHLVQASLR